MIHNILNIKAAINYVPYQDLENKFMLLGLLDKPGEFANHVQKYTNSLTTQMVFGFRTLRIDDPKLQQLFHGFDKWAEVTGSSAAHLLDLFPIFQKLPKFLVPTHRYAEKLHREEKKLYVSHWSNTKKAIKDGTGKEKDKFSDDLAGYISRSLLEAGSDTTAATLIGFIRAMAVFPEVQKKAQQEIDQVVDPDRLPIMEDAPQLQYIRGYIGYKIPAGASIINNVWAIHMDPARHLDPQIFNPDRYANDLLNEFECATHPDVSKRDHFVFGAGRRVCQGLHIAERSLFLGSISRMLWAFDFRKAQDSQGNLITPDIDKLTQGLLVLPEPFPAVIKARIEHHADLIRSNWRECEETLLDPETPQWKKVPEGMVFI